MIQARNASLPIADGILTQTRRISPRAFWSLFALEGAFVAVVLFFVVSAVLPSRAPLANSADYLTVRNAVWSRLNGDVTDPVIQIAPGVSARESSVRGFTINGQIYYYYLEGRRSYDPYSRGAVDREAIEVLLRDDGGSDHLVIYRLIGR